MDKSFRKRIDVFLADYALNYDALTKNQQEKFLVIDKAIQDRLRKIEDLKKQTRAIKINPNTIADDIQQKRTIFYQTPMYKDYISQYQTDEFSDVNHEEIKNIKQENEELKSQLSKMLDRDAEYGLEIGQIQVVRNLYSEENTILRAVIEMLKSDKSTQAEINNLIEKADEIKSKRENISEQ